MSVYTTDLISVVIPLYNHEDFISDAIHSIANQTYNRIEIIIIDDGSTDDGLKVATKTCNKFLKRFEKVIIKSQNNSGAAIAIDNGVKLSSGKYIAIQPSDDMSAEERLLKQLSHIKMEQLSVSYTGSQVISKTGKIIGQRRKHHASYKLSDILNCNYVLPAPSLTTTRENFDKINGFGNSKLEDMEFLLKTLRSGGKVGRINQNLVLYRRHKTNVSNNSKFILIERNKLLRKYNTNIDELKSKYILVSWLIFLERADISFRKKCRLISMLARRNKMLFIWPRFFRVLISLALPHKTMLRNLRIQ